MIVKSVFFEILIVLNFVHFNLVSSSGLKKLSSSPDSKPGIQNVQIVDMIEESPELYNSAQVTEASYSTPAYTTPEYTTPAQTSAYTTQAYTTSYYTTPYYTTPFYTTPAYKSQKKEAYMVSTSQPDLLQKVLLPKAALLALLKAKGLAVKKGLKLVVLAPLAAGMLC